MEAPPPPLPRLLLLLPSPRITGVAPVYTELLPLRPVIRDTKEPESL